MRGRRPNPIPSVQLNLALPLDVHTRLSARLYSDLEGRVPHGAYSRHIVEMLRREQSSTALDLAPWLGSPAGAFVVIGSPETLNRLQEILSCLK